MSQRGGAAVGASLAAGIDAGEGLAAMGLGILAGGTVTALASLIGAGAGSLGLGVVVGGGGS